MFATAFGCKMSLSSFHDQFIPYVLNSESNVVDLGYTTRSDDEQVVLFAVDHRYELSAAADAVSTEVHAYPLLHLLGAGFGGVSIVAGGRARRQFVDDRVHRVVYYSALYHTVSQMQTMNFKEFPTCGSTLRHRRVLMDDLIVSLESPAMRRSLTGRRFEATVKLPSRNARGMSIHDLIALCDEPTIRNLIFRRPQRSIVERHVPIEMFIAEAKKGVALGEHAGLFNMAAGAKPTPKQHAQSADVLGRFGLTSARLSNIQNLRHTWTARARAGRAIRWADARDVSDTLRSLPRVQYVPLTQQQREERLGRGGDADEGAAAADGRLNWRQKAKAREDNAAGKNMSDNARQVAERRVWEFERERQRSGKSLFRNAPRGNGRMLINSNGSCFVGGATDDECVKKLIHLCGSDWKKQIGFE